MVSRGGSSRRPALVTFALAKYARPLLVDAGPVSSFRGFTLQGRPHTLDFFDILLITAGTGRFRLDGETHTVRPGVAFFTRPGQVRQWAVSGIEGACVFFREEFVAEAFSDPRFLDQFAPFRPSRPTGALTLADEQQRQFLAAFRSMRREIGALRADTSHALRAQLYELLVLLDRRYVQRHGDRPELRNEVVARFHAQLDRDFRRRHRVGAYAAALGVTPGHLNALCRTTLHRTAGACVRARILLEAKRLLRYTDLPSSAIAHTLGFDDPSYFVRFFRRETGRAPIAYRRAEHA